MTSNHLTIPLTTSDSYEAAEENFFYYAPQARDLLIAKKVLIVKELIPHMIQFIGENIRLSLQDQRILEALRAKSYSRREITTLNHDEMEFLMQIIHDPEKPIEIEKNRSSDSQRPNQVLLAEKVVLFEQGERKNIFKLTQKAFKALQSWNRCCRADRIQKYQISWDDSACTRGFVVFFTGFAVTVALILIFGERTDATSPPIFPGN